MSGRRERQKRAAAEAQRTGQAKPVKPAKQIPPTATTRPAPAAPEPYVLIGRAHHSLVDSHFIDSYESLQKPARWDSVAVHRVLVHTAREVICDRALAAQDVTHVLMIDDDILAPRDGLLRLLAHDVPIVSGLYFQRTPPHKPTAYRLYPGGEQYGTLVGYRPGLQRVDACGAGFLLIKREVLEAIPRPWFAFVGDRGEDFYFCEQARSAGFSIWLDADVKVGHLTTVAIGEEHFRLYQQRGAFGNPPDRPQE